MRLWRFRWQPRDPLLRAPLRVPEGQLHASIEQGRGAGHAAVLRRPAPHDEHVPLARLHGPHLVHVLPKRISVLSLNDTDFSKRGKEMVGFKALCAFLQSPSCGIKSLNVARNGLPNEAGRMLSEAIARNTSLGAAAPGTQTWD